MKFKTLQQWLTWQESLNPKEIDLGLDRVEKVLHQLGLSSQFNCPVITLAGTNGKGSTSAFLQSMLQAAGYQVGCYTSPHLLKYNERISINSKNIDDEHLCETFEMIDQARGDVALTYFEFGTLAALVVFFQAKLDVVILEVGLGGRLDAVNVIDPDVSVITSIGLDHMDWLGADIESIGREKAGIFRPNKPAVYGGLSMPDSVKRAAEDKNVNLHAAGKDYLYQGLINGWQFTAKDIRYHDLPLPALKGSAQIQNAATAIMALHCMNDVIKVDQPSIVEGLQNVFIAGRFQLIHSSPDVVVDVAHNPQAARALLETLEDNPVEGSTYVVIAMLADKAVYEVVKILQPQIDGWFTAGLNVPRGLDAKILSKAVSELIPDDKLFVHQNVTQACEAAMQKALVNDRIVVLGSFYTVTEALNYFAN